MYSGETENYYSVRLVEAMPSNPDCPQVTIVLAVDASLLIPRRSLKADMRQIIRNQSVCLLCAIGRLSPLVLFLRQGFGCLRSPSEPCTQKRERERELDSAPGSMFSTP